MSLAKLKLKWRMLKAVLRNHDSILISMNDLDEGFKFYFSGSSLLVSHLFFHLDTEVKEWLDKWKKINNIKDEAN